MPRLRLRGPEVRRPGPTDPALRFRPGECFFSKPGEQPRIYVYVGADDDIYRYDVGFAEWLYRYLQGEDMAGPNSSACYPGRVRFDALPYASKGKGEFWFGPARPDRAE
ncbi:hypothetical protein ACIQXA_11355 [Streptomyces massasporeus]|uniref:hypothetical protein n=1 Tax=Streptomyces massasporeus TaxID=67324 RepID=UPI00380EBC2C